MSKQHLARNQLKRIECVFSSLAPFNPDESALWDLENTLEGLFKDLEAAERERDELRKTLHSTQGGATEAIKNVMRLQEEISRLNKESQRLSDQLGACDRQRLDWLKRALTAEAELARRYAAASEPVAVVREVINGLHVTLYQILPAGTELFTAAPPAVLPPKLSMDIDPEMQGEFRVHEAIRRKGFNQALEAALELGAQPQKPVFMPKSERINNGYYFDMDDIFVALDAAAVNYKVVK